MDTMIQFYGYDVYPMEIPHIEKHKYYLSEKANVDVGYEQALNDWFNHQRNGFLRWQNETDTREQRIALALHLAELKKQGYSFDKHEATARFARTWRQQHPRYQLEDSEADTCDHEFDIEYLTRGDFRGALIRTSVLLKNGIHIRPSTYLHSILTNNFPFTVFLGNRKTGCRHPEELPHLTSIDNRCFLNARQCRLLDFLEFSTIEYGDTVEFFIGTDDTTEIQQFCMAVSFLNRAFFC